MTQWSSGLKRWLGRREPPVNLIIIGVGYPSFSLGQAVQASGRYQIVAFIDDEPWNHRTQVLGVTVRYPGELAALIKRHGVQYVVRIADEPPVIADNIWVDVVATGVTPVLLPAGATVEAHLEQLRR